jgi:hypothetical protein
MDNVQSAYTSVEAKYIDYSPVVSNGILLAGIFSLIFLIAKIFGLEDVTWLRYVNYIIYFPIAFNALKKKYKLTGKLNYFNGLMIGFLTCLLGQFIYTVLFFIYLHFDKHLVQVILSQMPNGILNAEVSISFILFSEGFAWSAIAAFSLMQIFKWKRGRWAVH